MIPLVLNQRVVPLKPRHRSFKTNSSFLLKKF